MQEDGPREAGKSLSLETFKTPLDKSQEQASHSWPCFEQWMEQMTSFTTSVVLNVSSHKTVHPSPL